jgi:predicted DNA-binding protein (MmcQ/YjbR family)
VEAGLVFPAVCDGAGKLSSSDHRLSRNDIEGELAMIDAEWLRKVCLALPQTTEQMQWGCNLVFKVGGKMYAVAPLEPAPVCLSFKCSDESFAELTERPQIIPAPYLARAKWVALEAPEALSRAELARLLRVSYEQVFAKLPKRVQGQMSGKPPATKTAKKKTAGKLRRLKKN